MIGILLVTVLITGIVCKVFDINNKYIILIIIIFYILFAVLLDEATKKLKSKN